MTLPSTAPPAGGEATAVAVRVSVRCPSLEVFCDRYWRLVNGDRIFIVTQVPQAPGTRLRFTMVLSDGSEVMRGIGRVLRPRKTAGGVSGMEVKFEPLDEPSRELLGKLHALRAAQHVGEGGEFDERKPTSDFRPLPVGKPTPPPLPAAARSPRPLEVKASEPARSALEAKPAAPDPKPAALEPKPAALEPKPAAPEPKPPEARLAAVPRPPDSASDAPAAAAASPQPPAPTPAEVTAVSAAPPSLAAAPIEPRPNPSGGALERLRALSRSRIPAVRPASKAPPAGEAAPPPPAGVGVEKAAAASEPEKPAANDPSSAPPIRATRPLPKITARRADPPPAAAGLPTLGSVDAEEESHAPKDAASSPVPPAASHVPAPEPAAASPPAAEPQAPAPSAAAAGGPSVIIDQALVGDVPIEHLPPREPLSDEVLEPLPGVRFAEQWTEPGAPAAPDHKLPANPFAELGDDAIEFFVEWSIERSTAPADHVTGARFADVPMSWGAGDSAAPPRPRRALPALLAIGGVVVGLAGGIAIGARWLARSEVPAVAIAAPDRVAPPPAARPASPAEEAPPARPEAPPAQPEAPPAAGSSDLRGKLSVRSIPPGAQLTVDGKPAGRTPLELKLPAGKHAIAVERERYQTASRSAEVVADETARMTIDLQRPSARLSVVSQPPGAEIAIGGHPAGRAPLAVARPGYEHYTLRAWVAGRKPLERSVYLRPGDPPVSFNFPAPPPPAPPPAKPATPPGAARPGAPPGPAAKPAQPPAAPRR